MKLFQKTTNPVLWPLKDVEWATGAVFNPGVWLEDGVIHMLFRAIPEGYRKRVLVSAEPSGPSTGFDEYVSYIGYARSFDGIQFDVRPDPFIGPDSDADRFGAEDPRISKIGHDYLITYTALSKPAFGGDGVRIGLATTQDFRDVRKHGVVGPPVRDKDAVVFPRLVGGRVVMLHRILPAIQLISFDNIDQLCDPPPGLWERHLQSIEEHAIMKPVRPWEEKKIGAGPTPIETEAGWLLIYHGVDRNHVYCAGLALLDAENPSRVLARSPEPVLEPETDFELYGDVNNVVFPEGAVVKDGILHLYYGAADKVIGHATASMSDVLSYLGSAEARV
jgi:predicted GH43/DUF377 family glycosyl hydrolase